jgi:hypothetical protein
MNMLDWFELGTNWVLLPMPFDWGVVNRDVYDNNICIDNFPATKNVQLDGIYRKENC